MSIVDVLVFVFVLAGRKSDFKELTRKLLADLIV